MASDNGPLKGSLKPGAPEGTAKISNGHKSAGNLRGYKAAIFEGGHRTPFIAKWPHHIPPAATTDEPLCLVDLLATCAAIVGAKLPNNAGEDSFNMLAALCKADTKRPIRESIIHHSGGGAFSVRRGRWKIIFGKGKGHLYDLHADPCETKDLWSRHPEVVEELTRLMARYKTEGRSAPLR